jgi:hypothetical protein
MPFYDLDETDASDLPDEMKPDPYCVWVWIVAPGTNHAAVCFEKEMAERIQDAKTGDVGMRRTRMWFDDDLAEKKVHAVRGSGYNE